MSLLNNITSYLAEKTSEKGVWIHKGQLLQMSWLHKDGRRYMPNTVDRELRILEEQSIIARRDDSNRKSIEYKYIPEKLRELYIPYSCRAKGKEEILFKS